MVIILAMLTIAWPAPSAPSVAHVRSIAVRAHPFFRAGFIAIGDRRPIEGGRVRQERWPPSSS
jgi:hypothetical protein